MHEESARIERERLEKEQKARADAAERESRVRIRREAEAVAAARERERLAEEERRRAEEQARLDAIRTAELERVRAETAHRSAVESEVAARKHALELAAIRATATIRNLRMALAGTSVVAFVTVAALVWLELGVQPQRLASLEAEYARLTASERARADRAEDLFRTSDALRRELESRLKAIETRGVGLASPPTNPPAKPMPRVRPQQPRDKLPPCVDDNDPLNPCLSR